MPSIGAKCIHKYEGDDSGGALAYLPVRAIYLRLRAAVACGGLAWPLAGGCTGPDLTSLVEVHVSLILKVDLLGRFTFGCNDVEVKVMSRRLVPRDPPDHAEEETDAATWPKDLDDSSDRPRKSRLPKRPDTNEPGVGMSLVVHPSPFFLEQFSPILRSKGYREFESDARRALNRPTAPNRPGVLYLRLDGPVEVDLTLIQDIVLGVAEDLGHSKVILRVFPRGFARGGE